MTTNQKTENQFEPDYAVPPGDILEEWLEENDMSQAELVTRIGRPKKTINEIIKGKTAITPETAIQLENVTGINASFWNNAEAQYRDFIEREKEKASLKKSVEWSKKFPYTELVKLGVIQAERVAIKKVENLVRFFGVASPQQWEDQYAVLPGAARSSATFNNELEPISAWLRLGEISAMGKQATPFNEKIFKENLQKIRQLTSQPIKDFEEPLKSLCAEAGVVVIFTPPLRGCRVSGFTRWLTPHKALIQLSLRHNTNDHFWFSFFHECAHLLLHGKKDKFLEYQSVESQQETEADHWASNFLINSKDWKRFVEGKAFGPQSIKEFSRELGVAPGIIVGRLQHEKIVAWSHMNQLKAKFQWVKS